MLAKNLALVIAFWLVALAWARPLLADDPAEQACQKPEASAKGAPVDSTSLQGLIGSEADLTEADRKANCEGMVTGEGALFYIFVDSIHPTWSPDGKTVLLRKLDHERVPFGGRKVWSFDAATLQPKLLTHCWSNEFSPEYSPDGKSITFVSDRPLPEPAKPGQLGLNLWIMNADGSALRRFTDSATIMDQERKDLQECLAKTKDPIEAGRIRERLDKVRN
jgi:hypothetical protein